MGKNRNEERNEEEKKRSRDQRKINGEKKIVWISKRDKMLDLKWKCDEECEWTYTGG